MKRFPNLSSLASAREEEVLRYWQGLGYYSRARNILRTAQHIQAHWNGVFPQSRADLEALPGIGAYTAGAIMSLAWHLSEPLLDGNLVRIFSRLHGWNFLPNTQSTKQTYWQEAQYWCESGSPHIVNEALMELGALVCTPQNPLCSQCPLRPSCHAGTSDTWRLFPPSKTQQVERWSGYALVCEDPTGRLLFVRRRNIPFLKDQWNFPLWKKTEPPPENEAELLRYCWQHLEANQPYPQASTRKILHPVRHAITRYRIELWVIHLRLAQNIVLNEALWLLPEEMGSSLFHSLGLKIWRKIKTLS